MNSLVGDKTDANRISFPRQEFLRFNKTMQKGYSVLPFKLNSIVVS